MPGNAGTVLAPTAISDKVKILTAIDTLQPGGSTAGAQGLEAAYDLAQQAFVKGGVNRVMLATDGDFNVGPSSDEALKATIEAKRKSGIFPVGARLWPGKLQRRADAGAGAERQWHRRLYRYAFRSAEVAGRGGGIVALPDCQGCEIPGGNSTPIKSPNTG